MKRQYIEPQMTVVRIKRMTMICTSDPNMTTVKVNKNRTMGTTDDFE